MSSSEGGDARSRVNLCDVPEDRQHEVVAAVLAASRLSVLAHLRGFIACVTRASVVALLLLVIWPVTAEAAGAQYVYDAAGRLVQVIGASGTSAQYTYDAAGNLLAVTLLGASTAAVTGFSNAGGTTGSTLTIYGSGFSTTPGNNYVYFNGVAATVVSATSNSLTVTVPSGATTSTITVTDSNGTVTSAHPFAVSSPLPSISSFSPTIGAPGTTVTVSGSHFPTTASAVQATINGLTSSVTSSSASSVTITVPSGASPGPIVINTPAGSATSSTDFFALPAGFSSSLFAATGQLTIGGASLTATINTSGKYGLIAFAGQQGQSISVQTTSETFPSNCAYGGIYLYGPGYTTVGTTNFCVAGAEETLPVTGGYSLFLVPAGTDTGHITLLLQNAPIVTAAITIGGSSATVTSAIPAQPTGFTFTTTSANEAVSFQLLSTPYAPPGSCGAFFINLIGPLPAPATYPMNSNLSTCPGAQPITLPVVGTYEIAISTPQTDVVGTITAQLQAASPSAATGTATIGGSSVTLTTTAAGQQSELTFTTTSANQIVSVQVLSSTYSAPCTDFYETVSGPSPDATLVSTLNTCLVAQLITLPVAGTYTLMVSPFETTSVGSVTMQLQNAPTVKGAATIGGAAVPLATTVPAQQSQLSFTTSTANQSVTFDFSSMTYPSSDCSYDLSILAGPAPINPVLNTGNLCSLSPVTATFPTPGTYTITLMPWAMDTGSITYQLH
jgi:YD repeat-containing protein